MTLPSTEQIVEDLSFFDDWEDRYKYIIDLGRALPPMDDSLYTPERMVKGCQSNVWIEVKEEGGQLHFVVDSDAHIVRGLLAVIMAAYQDRRPQEILDFDVESYFRQLDLERHLSPTRGNGLRAMVAKVHSIARAARAA
ncbi:MAG: SufE family protein [Cellvibrionaceae bacterium]